MESSRGLALRNETREMALHESAEGVEPSLASIRLSKHQFNATLHDGQAVGLTVVYE